ncbi:Nif3-like dinuclear metal center hexameric protein [Alloscardovia macacae]|uniref:GTP cyclohydrolase 1 type 2 homolog n=1 Tax=Alloscardovia macacae TaxID=1160091 RepID=A0A261F598_9BIFI|nr:Nif3-like dinuclear metal center hexameric protein [Alloscardovia macacae]OZG54292.1 PadR family transcriptional regulator [Alloscardovia macacae]
MAVTLGEMVEVLETLYPLELAESWDEPGLIVGDPSWPVRKVYCAVDPTEETVQAAVDAGADLLITHHPLYFRATHTVAGSTFRGAMVTTLIENHCALWVGHTNVDSAVRGQGFAFVHALRQWGLDVVDEGPLVPSSTLEGCGLGRMLSLVSAAENDDEVTLKDFARAVSCILPATVSGVLVSGEPERVVHRVAVLPGSGDSEIATAHAAGADVYVTSDLRHHPVLDARQETGMAFIQTPHAAIEKLVFPILVEDVSAALTERFGQEGSAVRFEITELNTDPWDMRL